MTIAVKPLTGALGAEIIGADLRREADFPGIRQAFIDHSVIAIRGQELAPEDQLAFARRWGAINVNRFFAAVPEYPEIAVVLKEPDQTAAIGEDWHTDHSYDQIPAMGSILYALETPAVGGDTSLPRWVLHMMRCRRVLRQRWVGSAPGIPRATPSVRWWWMPRRHKTGASAMLPRRPQDALHPMVISHPLSGRKGLYVNPDFTTHIDGWSKAESAALLGYLYAHCAKPEFTCRVRRTPGTVTMWDNRATWHKAVNDYHGHRRLMHRVTVDGVELHPA
jgi:taurine dioxygenase